jgi:hypothetical protein
MTDRLLAAWKRFDLRFGIYWLMGKGLKPLVALVGL